MDIPYSEKHQKDQNHAPRKNLFLARNPAAIIIYLLCFLAFSVPQDSHYLPRYWGFLSRSFAPHESNQYHIAKKVTAPDGFPSSGNGLWYTEPGVNWSTQYLPIGNGYLGAMINGNPISDHIQLNIESLWTGGPFASPAYNGGNHPSSEAGFLASELQRIRDDIFANGTTFSRFRLRLEPMAGSYSGAGNLNVNRTPLGSVTDYVRWLNLDTAVLKATWTESNISFNRSYFCSNPTHACTVHTVTSTPGAFSATFSFSPVDSLSTPEIKCLDNTTIQFRGRATGVDGPGMLYEMLATIQQTGPETSVAGCAVDPASGEALLFVVGSTEAWVSWVGGTEYAMENGNAASGFSFKGADPHLYLVSLLTEMATEGIGSALDSHISDYRSALGNFSLNLGHTPDFTKSTSELKGEYTAGVGDPYMEWLLFNYGRYLLASSTRSHLPANLQGKWGRDSTIIWGSDYHVNINIQMNYWFAEMTNTKVGSSLWDYIEKTWISRGAETARILYNVTRGFVVHNEVNIFGHSGMKASFESAQWANYPESAAWMMIHVYDHLDYTGDVAWWRAQGWPLLKNVTSFWLDNLVKDRYFQDHTFVAAPCNSPEQKGTTLGCAHSQQLVWQLFEAAEKGFEASGDTDTNFLREVQQKKLQLDKGIKIGSFGQLQEWKIDLDNPDDTHRHLSHLVGLYPGYVLANFRLATGEQHGLPNVTHEQVLNASEISLIARGDGTGPDGDAGWEKVWRAACWAQLQNSVQFYRQLTYAVRRNIASNLLSVYDPFAIDPIFQIDANLGYPAAVLNALVQAPDTSSLSDPLRITLLPALPDKWNQGSIQAARIRGGMTLDLSWSGGKAIEATIRVDSVVRHERQVELWYSGELVIIFHTTSGYELNLIF